MLDNSQSTLNQHATNKLIHYLLRVNRWPTDIQVEHPSMSADALTMILAVSYRWNIGQLSVMYESIVELELTDIFYRLFIQWTSTAKYYPYSIDTCIVHYRKYSPPPGSLPTDVSSLTNRYQPPPPNPTSKHQLINDHYIDRYIGGYVDWVVNDKPVG